MMFVIFGTLENFSFDCERNLTTPMLPQVSRRPPSQKADVVTRDYCEAQPVQGGDAERNHSDMVRS